MESKQFPDITDHHAPKPTALQPTPQTSNIISMHPIALLVLLVILLGLTVFLGYQNIQLRNVIIQMTDGTEKILGLQLTSCCSCPKLIFPAQIGLDGWVKYEQGVDYSTKRPNKCTGLMCSPCEPIPSPTCRPRPACLDANPRCLMPETPDMCPPAPKTTPTSKYSCPENGWVDCMPGPGPVKTECSPEAMTWYKANCPNFQGGAY